jgi:2-polyprenyl-3-methyl-5-hydroxy-6-metoxy-1,4-benzoquinol methylase
MTSSRYNDGTYLIKNPTWHMEDSHYKATNIMRMIDKHNIQFKSCVEIGCGAGQILYELSQQYPQAIFHGYDISPQAISIAKQYETSNLKYFNKDILVEKDVSYDLVALIDVIEHIEDYMLFLRRVREISKTFLFAIPLEITVSSVLRNTMKDARDSAGHLHYFMKDTAIAALLDTGYEVIDYFYTRAALDAVRGFKAKLAWLPRKILHAMSKDACARILGGFPLLILAKKKG